MFRGNQVVLWLSSFGWQPLACHSRLWSFLNTVFCRVIIILFKLHWFVIVSSGCCQTTSGFGWSFGLSVVSGLSNAAPEWRRGVSSLNLGLQLEHSYLNCFGLLSVGLDLVLPVVYSGSQSLRCVCSEVLFLCGMVSSTTAFTGWVDRPRSSVSLILFIVGAGLVRNLIVGVRVCLTTIIIIIVIVSTIPVVSGLVFFSFELTALISKETWLFAVLASWFGFFWVLLCDLLRHSIYLQFIWGFQTIQF